ncbi:hypothetical protein COS79_03675 [Candidatus Woesearchaeota archaeon CG06_land_8_20_14_3_00_33_13]|nr:MAG: hypothetical protein COV14_04555 [Candidatus Woesearchaeota archaeon CG10_big_fil_rev_8_21_14_0_10_33_12]PIU72292.1 MAG: hypothetical protein COS79_03675 [Candidatus Woesearchaeota archaeon CG06_land_8_20_14_3_00_33_13]
MEGDQDLRKILSKYREKLNEELNTPIEETRKEITSTEYIEFKKDFLPSEFSLYEKLCNLSEKVLKIKPDEKAANLIKESIDICHLNVTPTGTESFAILIPLIIIIFGSLLSFLAFKSFFFIGYFVLVGLILMVMFRKLPEFLANNWRLKASNQMVQCIFYIVTFMRHTSNLEGAIAFAAEHIAPPLSLDMKKVLWDVETEKYESVKESLDIYLETWRKWNIEFIESFHLIESSLYEPSEDRRLSLVDRALDVMLEGTYEKMLHYAHNLQSPIQTLHMLGVIMPLLGLVILPLIVSFMGGIKWYTIALIYNITLPITVYYMGKIILSKRPTGYGETDISQANPELMKYKNIIIRIGSLELRINPIFLSISIGIIFLIIGLLPVILPLVPGFVDPAPIGGFHFLDYHTSIATEGELVGKTVGPFGLGAAILSFFVTLAFGLSIGIYYNLKSKNLIDIRENTKKLENEFASALFQLGNRLGDGLPAEIAFGRVAEIMRDTASGNFFNIVSMNISKLGMSVKEAIFNNKSGAILYFPSNIIQSSMKVLLQSIKKGPVVAAQALVNVSRYIKEIHRVNERLKDLLADVISSMKSQLSFIAPAIAGVVVGITSMVTTILGTLGIQMRNMQAESGAGGAGNIVGMFGDGMPTYYFQIIVGIYVVEIIYILTILANGIENGSDTLNEQYLIGQNMLKSTLLYVFIAFIVTLLFNFVAGTIMTNLPAA